MANCDIQPIISLYHELKSLDTTNAMEGNREKVKQFVTTLLAKNCHDQNCQKQATGKVPQSVVHFVQKPDRWPIIGKIAHGIHLFFSPQAALQHDFERSFAHIKSHFAKIPSQDMDEAVIGKLRTVESVINELADYVSERRSGKPHPAPITWSLEPFARDSEKDLFYAMSYGAATARKDLSNHSIATPSDGALSAIQRRLNNRALVEQKIIKIERKIAEKESLGEKRALEWMKEDLNHSHKVRPSQDKVRQATIAALKAWQESPELSQRALQEVDLVRKGWEGQLRAYGATDGEIASLLKDLLSIRELWDKTLYRAEEHILSTGVLNRLPELQKEPKLDGFKRLLGEQILSQSAQGKQRYAHLARALQSFTCATPLFANATTSSFAEMTFFEKWKPYLKQEFRQAGDACLKIGVCGALSKRWTVENQKDASFTIDQIKSQDRFHQARCSVACQLNVDQKTMTQRETLSNELARLKSVYRTRTTAYEKLQQVPDMDRAMQQVSELRDRAKSELIAAQLKYNTLDNTSYDELLILPQVTRLSHGVSLHQKIVPMLDGMTTIEALQGTAQVIIRNATQAHAICIRYQPDAQCYRILDPNFGLFQLESPEQFVDCLADLIQICYPWWHTVETIGLLPPGASAILQ